MARMTMLRRILVPLDGSALAEQALPLAAALAGKFESKLLLLRVLDLALPVVETRFPESHWIREAQQSSFREAQGYLDTCAETLIDQGLPVQTSVHDGPPAEDILAVAANEQIDLIVISSHGKGGASLWTSGSVADKVMQHSPCPVLLVRQPPSEHNGTQPNRLEVEVGGASSA
jgi:nucleotide-binding universal stress UspA family protein